MVVDSELDDAAVDRIFRALADATRRDILTRTIVGEQSVSELAAEYDMSFAAVQKHVAVLEAANLIVKRAEGRERLVRADPGRSPARGPSSRSTKCSGVHASHAWTICSPSHRWTPLAGHP